MQIMHTQRASITELAPVRPLLRPSFSRNSVHSSGRKTVTPNTQLDDDFQDISPTIILQHLTTAIDSTSDLPANEKTLLRNIESATGRAKAFALRVARTSTLLKEWSKELEDWIWNGTFGPAILDGERAELPKAGLEAHNVSNGEYWGSLPKTQVLAYEERLDEIYDRLEDLDIEEQKSRTLKSVIHTSPSKAISGTVVMLDDLTNYTTTILLQALPSYTRLASMLETWSLRVAVFQQVPMYFVELRDAQRAREDAWFAIGVRVDSATGSHQDRMAKVGSRGLLRDNFESLRNAYEDKIAYLGKRIDTMLDILEGRGENLPDTWIDAVEELELDYSSWTVEAGRKVLQYEHGLDIGQLREPHTARAVSIEKPESSYSNTIVEQDVPHVPGGWEDDDQLNEMALTGEIVEEPKFPHESPDEVVRSLIYGTPSPTSLSYRTATPSGFFPRVASTNYTLEEDTDSTSSRVAAVHNNYSTMTEQSTSSKGSGMSLHRSLMLSHDRLSNHSQASRMDEPFLSSMNLNTTVQESQETLKSTEPAPGGDRYGQLFSDKSSLEGRIDGIASRQSAELPIPTPEDSSVSDSNSIKSEIKEYLAGSAVAEAPPFLRVPLIKRGSTTNHVGLGPAFGRTAAGSNENEWDHPTAPRTPSPSESVAGRTDAQFEEVIQRMLTSLSTKIKLQKEPFDSPPVIGGTRQSTEESGIVRTLTNDSNAGLMLIPAYQSESRLSKLGRNSAIKLFYLIDGQRSPIKLFVRVFGENGQVVVRVGGGWAMLDEYLREYAQHHGRASSPERFVARDSPRLLDSFPGRLPHLRDQSPERSLQRQGTPNNHTTPCGSSPARPCKTAKASPSLPPIRTMGSPHLRRSQIPTPNGTPRIRQAGPISPSTPTHVPSSPRKAISEDQESEGIGLGLMGPAVAGRTKMSPQKEKWVSDMMAQVQTGSPVAFEKGMSGGDLGFEEMGKVGPAGTREGASDRMMWWSV